jgi:hypothetical protein
MQHIQYLLSLLNLQFPPCLVVLPRSPLTVKLSGPVCGENHFRFSLETMPNDENQNRFEVRTERENRKNQLCVACRLSPSNTPLPLPWLFWPQKTRWQLSNGTSWAFDPGLAHQRVGHLIRTAASSQLEPPSSGQPPYSTRFSYCSSRTQVDLIRDNNLDTGIRSDRYGYEDDFLPVGSIRIWSESRQVCDEYFFPHAGNPTGTRYFTTAIILGCE